MVGVLAPGLMLAVGTSNRMAKTTQKRAIARGLAVQKIEEARNMARTVTGSTGTTTSTVTPVGGGTFNVSRTISQSGDIVAVEVTVSWADTRGNGIFTDSLQMGTAMRVGT